MYVEKELIKKAAYSKGIVTVHITEVYTCTGIKLVVGCAHPVCQYMAVVVADWIVEVYNTVPTASYRYRHCH